MYNLYSFQFLQMYPNGAITDVFKEEANQVPHIAFGRSVF